MITLNYASVTFTIHWFETERMESPPLTSEAATPAGLLRDYDMLP